MRWVVRCVNRYQCNARRITIMLATAGVIGAIQWNPLILILDTHGTKESMQGVLISEV